MKLNNISFCKNILTALSLGGISAVHASSVDNVDTNTGISQSGDGGLINNARILNGEPAKREDFPYIGLFGLSTRFASRGCQVSLISNKTAVTTASCFLDEKGELLKDNQPQYIMLVSGTLRNVIPALHLTHAIHIHPEFSPKSLENDIAVIELKSPVSKDIVTPVAIYSGNVTDDMSLVTAGWGEISAGVIGLSNSELKTATQSPSSSSVCKDANAIWSDNNKNIVCTLVKDGKSLAKGDGGNPLAYINNGVNLLVGIASTTGRSESGADIRPEYTETNYYTHVYSYIDWIVNVTGLEKSYLLNTAVRPLPNYSTIGNVQTYGDYPISISASTILQNTGFTLVIFLSLVLVLLF